MLNIQTSPPKQVLLRLPDDVAAKLARVVPPRQRNRYIVDLLKQDLLAKQEAENRMMAQAADRIAGARVSPVLAMSALFAPTWLIIRTKDRFRARGRTF